MRRIRLRLFLIGLIALLGWLAVVGIRIHRFGSMDQARPADCIIVLGAAVSGDMPSPVFEERLRHGVNLQRQGMARRLILTGGYGAGSRHPESAVGATYARRNGVPDAALLTEERSHTTKQNLIEAAALMKEHRLRSAIIVSDPLHMKRAMMMAGDLGMEAVSSPTPSSRYRTWRTWLPFLLREIYFFHHYLVVGD